VENERHGRAQRCSLVTSVEKDVVYGSRPNGSWCAVM
jgi:hypothetical protein